MKLKIALLAASMLAGFSLWEAQAQSVTSICVKNASNNCTQVSPTAAFPVNVVAGGTGGGAVYGPTAVGAAAANPPILVGGTADATATGVVQVQKVDSSGNAFVAVTSSALPTGAATSANQTTGNTSLGTIATNTGTTSTGVGAPGDSACATDNGTCSAIALIKRTNQNVTTLNTTASGPIPAQSSDGVKIGAVQGTVASGSTADTYPVLVGGRAATAAPTAVTDRQTVRAQFTETGRFVTAPYSIKELMVRGTTTSTDTSAHTIIASAGGSLKNYITALQCGRTDAGATAIVLTLSDAASTVVILPSGGATNILFPIPLATAAATAFQVTSGTGVSTLYCSAQGYTGL